LFDGDVSSAAVPATQPASSIIRPMRRTSNTATALTGAENADATGAPRKLDLLARAVLDSAIACPKFHRECGPCLRRFCH
jgi:hypothetical protein